MEDVIWGERGEETISAEDLCAVLRPGAPDESGKASAGTAAELPYTPLTVLAVGHSRSAAGGAPAARVGSRARLSRPRRNGSA